MLIYPLALATPAFACHYDATRLNAEDRARLARSPGLAQRPQWQTSRALLQHIRRNSPDMPLCLSHKHDHSLIATNPHGGKPGVDLEHLRPRDFLRLAEVSCSAQEIMLIRQSERPAHTFYWLWTIKEALIKAEDLRFPTDLRQVGLIRNGGAFAIRSLRKMPYRWISVAIAQQWILSALWPDAGAGHCQLNLYAWQSAFPEVRRLGGNMQKIEISIVNQ